MTTTPELISLEELMAQLDHGHIDTNEVRKQVAFQLQTAVKEVDLTDVSNPKHLEGKMMLVSGLLSTLNDIDKNQTNRVNVRLKKKDADSNAKTSEMVTELLARISLTSPAGYPAAMRNERGTAFVDDRSEAELDAVIEREGLVVSDGELLDDLETELPDVTPNKV